MNYVIFLRNVNNTQKSNDHPHIERRQTMHPNKLSDIRALEIIDNRGMPTIRTQVLTDTGCKGAADVPCGSSTGAYEASYS